MLCRTRKLNLLFVGIFCFGQGFASVHFFHPPVLNVNETYIELTSNSTLEVTCHGKYRLSWKIDSAKTGISNDSRLSVESSTDPSRTPHRSTLTLRDLDFNDSGFYSCHYAGTSDFESADSVTSVYVFVHDPSHLFVEKSSVSGHLLVPVQQHRRGVIPCLPTSPRLDVTLWKTEEGEEKVEGGGVTFDPTLGFLLPHPSFYFSGAFQCRATPLGGGGAAAQEINVTLIFLPDTYHDPQPFIETADGQHPVVNGTFTLKCVVNVDPGTRLFIEWDYPALRNGNETSGARINQTKPVSEKRVVRNYEHQEVVTYLVVKEARPTDSGRYACTVTDHSQKTGRAEVNVFVYSSQQRTHVNFTTDVNVLEPVVYQAGQDVRFVVTAHAYPSIADAELYWERNGRRLASDGGRYAVRVTHSTVVLDIRELRRSDAGIYTLYGRTKDGTDQISIMLEVKDKPVVSLKNLESLYALEGEYSVECLADGYPAPVVWWRWKPCRGPVRDCDPGGRLYGWTDVEHSANTPNSENVTLEYSGEGGSLVSRLHVTARVSGHYVCAASNEMGNDGGTVPFFVTDARDGFEISASKRRPVDRDRVRLECKVDAHNFARLQWKWRPMQSPAELLSLENLTDVTLERNSSVYSLTEVAVFDPIRVHHSGEYECVASDGKDNRTASKHVTIDVIEIEGPVVYKTNMNGSSLERVPGSLQEFFCYAEGVPPPEVTWRKDGEAFDAANMSGVEVTDQKLTIRRVLERDAGFYECVVVNRGGRVVANATLRVLEDGADDRTSNTLLIAFTTGAVAVTIFISLLCCFCWAGRYYNKEREMEFEDMARNMLKREYNNMFNPELPLGDQVDLLPYKSSWEFPRERLKLGKTLGQGAFGRVVKAEAIGLVDGEASTTVAVKMLKDGADKEQRKALIAELKILIHIGKHLNIVNLLGAVTRNLAKGELYVIVEYCCFGNLRHFLLKHKGTFLDQLDHRTGQLDAQISTLPGSPFSNNVIAYSNILGIGMDNPTYKLQSLHYADIAHDQAATDDSDPWNSPSPVAGSGGTAFITTCDLLCFAFQCARGMEYLESRKLIHRDLAARNVLLAKDNIVKICDFGLAKDCYKYSNYIKKSNGLLPIKWMAIESIRDRVFTSKTDVWSFGILLWEIFTLGSSPYPGAEINEEFFKKLKRGYRMEKPDLAPDSIYQLMKKCWLDDPNQRPDFTHLAENIGASLESSVRKYYVELNAPYQILNKELLNNNDYLQMTGQGEEYTNMVDSSGLPQIAGNAYDNIPPVPETPPTIQLERVSMSQMDNELELRSEDYDDGPNHTDTTYLNMGTSPENYDLDAYDSVFLEQKTPNRVPHINGDFSSVPLLTEIDFMGEKHDSGGGCMIQSTM